MKKWSLYFLLIVMAFSPMLQSCNDDDDYSLGNFMIRMATVEKASDTTYPYFVLDNGETVWISAPMVPFTHLEDGQRVVANFTLLAKNQDGFNYLARLNNYSKVLTKDIINLTEADEDSIGNSKATITDMWIGADYLNVEFWMVTPSGEKHMVNLVNNRTIAPEDDGYAHLEFRYNNMGDENGRLRPAIVSFELGDYSAGSNGLKGLKVKINSIKNGEKVLTFDYPLEGGEAAPQEAFVESVSDELLE